MNTIKFKSTVTKIEKLEEKLIDIWSKNLDLNIENKRVRIIKTEVEYAPILTRINN